MRCPYCNSENTQVKDSRPVEENTVIRRRRTCGACGQRFTTFERVQLQDIDVLKSDGRRQPFDRDKLKRSIMIAARKRQLDEERLDQALSNMVRKLESSGETAVSASVIGQMALDMLADIDQVAFVRYASVYQDFKHPDDFREILSNITPNKNKSSKKQKQ